jgi:acetylcholinesterase
MLFAAHYLCSSSFSSLGGFQAGDTSNNPGNTVVERAIALNEPIIYVSANYRLSALGFLGGKEVKAAGIGNAGLRDQRFAMEWVQEHITSFGGDPKRVTIWGESAGAVSVGLHHIVNNGVQGNLFRSAIMESGSPLLLRPITDNQPFFNQLVADTGCASARDAIACLRTVPFANLSAAINLTPNIFSFQSLQLTWQPTVDGVFITRNPQLSVQKGLFSKVPIITGDCDDEGTLFSLTTLNITDNAEFLNYIETNYGIPQSQSAALQQAYPDDVTQGSPFDTGTANAITPEFKRIAAIQGDLIFQAPRRFFLEAMSKTQKTFAFLSKRGKATPGLGAFHSSDIPEFYGTGDSPDFIGTDALVNFVNTGDPNTPKNPASLLSKVDWQPWGSSAANPPLLTFLDPAPTVMITFDTYRADAMKILTNISLAVASGLN